MPGAITPKQNQRSRAGIGDETGNKNTYVVTASFYGKAPGAGGSCGTLNQIDQQTGKPRLTYAELSTNSSNGQNNNYAALGRLPCGTPLEIGYNGKSVVAYKADVGFGGAGVSGHARVIDLYYNTAEALGFSGLGLVHIRRLDGQPIGGAVGSPATLKGNPFADISNTGSNPVTAVSNAANSAIDAVTSPLSDISKAISFIFSLQFLYVIAGGGLLLLAIIFIFLKTDTGKTVKKGVETAAMGAAIE